MSTSSPERTRQPRRPSLPSQAESNPSPRGEGFVIVVRSILFAVAAILVIATSNYFAYLIGRKQVAYEELRTQVDRIVRLADRKQAEDELVVGTVKQQQERLEQSASRLTGLTTSTINGKTIATSEPAPAGKPITAALIDDTAVVPPAHEMRLQPSQRSARRQRVSAAPRRGPAGQEIAGQPGQFTTAIPAAAPEAGAAGQ